ncbi:MAG: hypothetical protein K6F00_07035 [Lachnospiraceae bacterium]|nr:hypothetical protein [Lachnospiraceae bacterium]
MSRKTLLIIFLALDELIKIHQHKYTQIVNVKRSMLEKLFIHDESDTPEIRFGEYRDSWEIVSLGDIVTPYTDPVETPYDGYLRLGIRSYGKGTFHDTVKAGQELGTAQMHRVAAHKFIVTFLQQKELYDQLEIKLNDGIQKQTEVVKALEKKLDAMPEGLAVVDETITADKLTKELVDAFVEKVILKPERQVEIVWKFK